MSTAPSSSKIPKQIRSIMFDGEKITTITFKERYKPAGSEEIIEEIPSIPSTQTRHGAFNRAMERMSVHAMIRCDFADFNDRHGKLIDADWFDEHLYEDDPRFNSVGVRGIIVTSKDTVDSFQILVSKTTEDGEVIKFKCPAISLIKVEGWNYPLQALAQQHFETLLIEAMEYRKGKSAAGQLKLALLPAA